MEPLLNLPVYPVRRLPLNSGSNSGKSGDKSTETPTPLSRKESYQPLRPMGIPRQKGHLIVDALAGTGKTFSIVKYCEMIRQGRPADLIGSSEQEAIWEELLNGQRPNTIGVMMFGSDATASVKERLKHLSGITVMSSHGFGMQTIAKSGIRSKLDRESHMKKTMWLFEQYMQEYLETPEIGLTFIKGFWPTLPKTVERLVSLCKINLIDLDKMEIDEQMEQIEYLAERHSLEVDQRCFKMWKADGDDPFLPEIVSGVLKMSAAEQRFHDFDDMIWWPYRLNLEVRKVDLLLGDERQDFNLAQQELVFRSGRRICLVGDINQAIFGFAGADYSACERMRTRLESTTLGCKSLPLTYSRRNSKAVVKLANSYKDTGLKALDDAPEGAILYDKEESFLDDVKPEDMVLCRTNAPLIQHALRMMKQRRKVLIHGQDFGEQLVDIVDGLDAPDCVIGITLLGQWYLNEMKKMEAWKFCPDDMKNTLTDKWMALKGLMESSRTISEVTTTIQVLFGTRCEKCERILKGERCKKCGHIQDRTGALFSSIHRAKGLEPKHRHNKVWWLRYDLCPLPTKTPEEAEQETNLCYVAATRAKDEIVLVETLPEVKEKELESKDRYRTDRWSDGRP